MLVLPLRFLNAKCWENSEWKLEVALTLRHWDPAVFLVGTNAFSDSITFNLFVDLFKGFCVPDSFQRRTVPYICE